MSSNKTPFFFFAFFVFYFVDEISGHGRLMNPPARNTMWRLGYNTSEDYTDNELWCGGYTTQWGRNNGSCGICGDPWDEKPRKHEPGGPAWSGIVVRRYSPGQFIKTEVDLTTNHFGMFEFRLCENNDPNRILTEDCLKHVLKVEDENGRLQDSFTIPAKTEARETFFLRIKLPPRVSCSHCLIQWKYTVANTWGSCDNGTNAVGCGPQETFINCADVAIIPNTGGQGPPRPSSSKDPDNPFLIYVKDYTKDGNPLAPVVIRTQVCVGTASYKSVPGIDTWCQTNCHKYPPNCPPSKCRCPHTCEGIGAFKNVRGNEMYCNQMCLTYPSKCPDSKCVCS